MTTALVPGSWVGDWHIVTTDGKRVSAVCRCGTVRLMGAEALADGSAAKSCGKCTPSRVGRTSKTPSWPPEGRP